MAAASSLETGGGKDLALLRICVDMDEVIADTLGEHTCADTTKRRSTKVRLKLADLWGKGLWDVVAD